MMSCFNKKLPYHHIVGGEIRELIFSILCFCLEETCIASVHIPLARMNHVVLCNCKKVEKYRTNDIFVSGRDIQTFLLNTNLPKENYVRVAYNICRLTNPNLFHLIQCQMFPTVYLCCIFLSYVF